MNTTPPNRRWIWYFAILAALAVAAVVGLIAYNIQQQLTPEKLAAAKAQWEQKGPRDYRLVYRKSGNVTDQTELEVRAGKTIKVTVREQDKQLDLEPRLYPHYGMDALFGDLQRFLEMKSEAGSRRRFLRADFDPNDGHITRFVLSDPPLDVTVLEFEPLPPLKSSNR